MSGYRTVVVGTDGSDSSLRAVDKAGQIAAGSDAKVVVATAYFPQSEDQHAADMLKDEATRWQATRRSTPSCARPGIVHTRPGRQTSRRRRSSERRSTHSSTSPR